MATIVKLLIVAAILNAAVRGGTVAWAHYQLEDEAQRLVQFESDQPDVELHKEIRVLRDEIVALRAELRQLPPPEDE